MGSKETLRLLRRARSVALLAFGGSLAYYYLSGYSLSFLLLDLISILPPTIGAVEGRYMQENLPGPLAAEGFAQWGFIFVFAPCVYFFHFVGLGYIEVVASYTAMLEGLDWLLRLPLRQLE